MPEIADPISPSPSRNSRIPPLQNGDHLTRAEFERRFDATPRLSKAELIEGKAYLPSPGSLEAHGRPHVDLAAIFGVYSAATPGVSGSYDGSIRLDADNMPQPDICLLITEACGGQSKIDADGYVAGAPELIGEIAASSVSYDLHDKLWVYRRHAVREYIVWRTLDGEIDHFILRDGEYQRLAPNSDGFLRSEVFPGLWVDATALIAGDLALVLKKLQLGLASSEHETFVASLRQAANRSSQGKA